MKLIILFAVIGACAAGALPRYGAPQYRYPYYDQRARAGYEANAAILRSENEVNENGYHYAYDTENGIQAEETGVENNGNQAAGGYSYTGDDGNVYAVRYTADVNGFRPEGAHLPTPPPIPEAIARSLEFNARNEAAGVFDDGRYIEGRYDGRYDPKYDGRFDPKYDGRFDGRYAPGSFLARNQHNRYYNPYRHY